MSTKPHSVQGHKFLLDLLAYAKQGKSSNLTPEEILERIIADLVWLLYEPPEKYEFFNCAGAAQHLFDSIITKDKPLSPEAI